MMNFQCIWIIISSIVILFCLTAVFGQQMQLQNDKNDGNNDPRISRSGNVFMGMRGKKMLDGDLEKTSSTSLAEVKRLDEFMAPRGKKFNLFHNIFDEMEDPVLYSDNKRAKAFFGMRGKKEPFDGEINRWTNPKFFAMRGKRTK